MVRYRTFQLRPHAHIVASLKQLGGVLKGRGKLPKAMGKFRDALAMEYKLHGEDANNPEIATSLHNLGVVRPFFAF